MNAFETNRLTEAARSLWYDDNDDKQFTIQPARLNTLRGSRQNYFSFLGEYLLPDSDNFYVLYELGQVSPEILGIETNLMSWISLDTLSLMNDLYINVHIKQRMLPLSSIYILKDNRKNILLAVDVLTNRQLLNSGEALYFRVYSNNWLAETGQAVGGAVGELGGLISVIDDAIPILSATSNSGNQWLYHNGYYVNAITPAEIDNGDTLTVAWDSTGRGYLDFPITDLKAYVSTLDSRGKLLLQLPNGASNNPLVVEPGDEAEIYLCAPQPNEGTYARIKGFLYSRLFESDLRMLTHRDWGLDALRIETLLLEHSGEMETANAFIRVFLRQHTNGIYSGEDGNYIKDLMRVALSERESLMVGTAGTYDGWRPGVLETSAVMTWQQANTIELDLIHLKNVYSRESLNNSARTGVLTGVVYQLPYVAEIDALLLCYDTTGLLIDVIRVVNQPALSTVIVPLGTMAVECLPGSFTPDGLGMDRDTPYTGQADYWDEQFYYRTLSTDDWTVALPGVDYTVEVETGLLQWDVQHESDARMRRTLRDGIYRQLSIEPEILYHPIPIYESGGPPTLLPLSRLDVYLNGRRCVEGLDFTVDYPFIQITNKEFYLNETATIIDVKIFHHGVPDRRACPYRYGFIKQGILRDTDPDVFYQYRDSEFTVDGYRTTAELLGLYETPDVTSDLRHREGGVYGLVYRPYVLSQWAMSRIGTSADNPALEASGAVSKLMPSDITNTAILIPYGHSIYSPWVKRILVAIRTGDIDVEALGYSTTAVTLAVAPYIDGLATDILSQTLDWEMVDVHPTPNLFQVDITEGEMLFLRTLNRIYCNNRLTFNTYVNTVNNQ